MVNKDIKEKKDMKNFRMGSNTTAHYSSFEEVAKAFGCKPIVKQTKDKEKLEIQRNKFVNRHLCSACEKPMVYTGGNLMVCKNENCLGIKHETKNDETGEVRVWYTPSFDLLDSKGAVIAENIFA